MGVNLGAMESHCEWHWFGNQLSSAVPSEPRRSKRLQSKGLSKEENGDDASQRRRP
ncbi:hypothetical protein KIN20_009820 [Parelaphostrongylus tenuis]|uniref:Uncharacterized protein n=1 Tax=Parelaphostrongylus tenuis TaxID=148309 RepID=A0AAD5MPK3_PARTN|nr:hypothetical protein KIN20_009820 [Parelaphostrongylus tenuis]